jgi:hypothetical protein
LIAQVLVIEPEDWSPKTQIEDLFSYNLGLFAHLNTMKHNLNWTVVDKSCDEFNHCCFVDCCVLGISSDSSK